MGLLDYNTSDGRFLFMLPWQGHTLVGTTDTKGPVREAIYHCKLDGRFTSLMSNDSSFLLHF